jgi:1-hydroxycarotenoid 3,4-desaturase
MCQYKLTHWNRLGNGFSMKTVIIGAGMGGLSAAIALAAKGERVVVMERQSGPGGKMLPQIIDGSQFDTGPTVFTMRWVFEELFDLAGQEFSSAVDAKPLETLARHGWRDGVKLDLFADQKRSEAAVGEFAGVEASLQFRSFMAESKLVYEALEKPFLRAQRPSMLGLAAGMGFSGMTRISPFESLWKALQRHFTDPRLRQLFGRYATYCGSSPFESPATLMLIAHVEAMGVWRLTGGMAALAIALEGLAKRLGVEFVYDCGVAEIKVQHGHVNSVVDHHGVAHSCDAIICSSDANAVASKLFGPAAALGSSSTRNEENSLSAITWCLQTKSSGFELSHHTVFFSDDYIREFEELKIGPATDPTVYVCDQGEDRKLLLINAPARNSTAGQAFERHMLAKLSACGLQLAWPSHHVLLRTPQDFAQLYPATNGALYGRASHGWQTTFKRPQARTKVPGLYLAGGSVHPGPGVPMAALSGMRAAEALLQDRASTR